MVDKYYVYVIDNHNGFYKLRINQTKRYDPNTIFWFKLPVTDNTKNKLLSQLKKYAVKTNNDIYSLKITSFAKIFDHEHNIKQIHSDKFKHCNKMNLNDFINYCEVNHYDFMQSRIIIDTMKNEDNKDNKDNKDNEDKQSLMREYHRVLLINEIMTYERNYLFIITLEKMLIDGINKALLERNTTVLKPDPVTSGHFDYDFLKNTLIKSTKKLSNHEVDKLIETIKDKFDEFNAIDTFSVVPYGYDKSTKEFFCGEYRHKLIPVVESALFWKLDENNINDRDTQIFKILMSMLRYASICGLYTQWSLPEKFYEHLMDNGYNCEGFASPFNSQMLVIDYKTRKNRSVFCSLFFDVDEPFGCIGNFFTTDFGNSVNSTRKTVIVPMNNEYIIELIKKYIIEHSTEHIAEDEPHQEMMFVYLANTIKTGTENIIICTDAFYFENKTLTETVVNFNYGNNLNINIYGPSPSKKVINVALLREPIEMTNYMKKLIKKLAVEWSRYLVVKKMQLLGPQSGQLNYEWNNILERFLLAMANIGPDKFNDHVFKDLSLDHPVYQLMVVELSNKQIKHNNLPKQLHDMINAFLTDGVDKILDLPNAYGFSGVGYYCGSTYNRIIDRNRNMKLITKLSQQNKSQYFSIIILICLLRYECILSMGQHWNFPFIWYEYIYNNFNVRLEGFSSPFNSQLLMAEKNINNGSILFGSLFYDTDKYFGSIGNIFDLDISKLPRLNNSLSISVNPPYVEAIMERMIDTFNKWFELGINLTIFTGVPPWHDANYMKQLKHHKYLVYTKELFHGNFYYENSNDPTVPRIKLKSSVVLFVLSNNSNAVVNYETMTEKFGTVKYLM